MTRDEIKQIISDKFKAQFDVDVSHLEGNFALADLNKFNDKIDSLEILSFIIEIEEHFNIEVKTVETQVVTIDDLIDFVLKYVSEK
jgi:acyl carrier protein